MGKETSSASPNNATPEQQRISEVNMSYDVFHCRDLLGALDYIRPNNRQGEYYVTDVPGLLVARGKEVRRCRC